MFMLNKMSFLQFVQIRSALCKMKIEELNRTPLKILMSSLAVESNVSTKPAQNAEKEVKMSKAMRAYMERAKLYDQFMKVQVDDYEIGRRHLANMMGENPETFTQDDINKAVEYLMPSGLFNKISKPIFDHPTKLFPKRKDAEFDMAGRPFHFLFFTAKPNYNNALHDITEKIIQLNKIEDKMIATGIRHPESSKKVDLSGTNWMKKDLLEKVFIESLTDNEYEQFLMCIKRIADHPYSESESEFIKSFCITLKAITHKMEVQPLLYDESDRPYAEAEGKRKNSQAKVIVRGNGSGKFEVDGKDITFFDSTQDREQIMFPLDFTDLLNKVDVEAKIIRGEGHSTFSGAIRLGISRALCSFVTKEMIERMRLAGLLTPDFRTVERQKIGQKGARAKHTWKKR